MQRKQTLGGKKKYVFEPKIPQQEVPVPEHVCSEHPENSGGAEAPADASVVHKMPTRRSRRTAATSADAAPVGLGAAEPDVAKDACDMVFARENDPKCIALVEYKTIAFHEDTCFVMELPNIADGEFVVFDDDTCAVTNGVETVAMHPLAGASQLVVELDGERIIEIGTAAYTVSVLFLQKKRDEHAEGSTLRQVVILGLLLGLSISNILNVCGTFVGYTQGFVLYRSQWPSLYERALQALEVLFDLVQRSTLFMTATLFIPTLCDICRRFGDSRPPQSFTRFIVTFAVMRLLMYPLIYTALRPSINAALCFVDIFGTAESCLLIYIFLGIRAMYKEALSKDHTLYRFRRMVFETRMQGLVGVLGALSAQLFIDAFFKTAVVIASLSGKSLLSHLILDSAYLLRLVSLSVQLYCTLKVCSEKDMIQGPEDDLSKLKYTKAIAETKNAQNDQIEPKNCHYFTQPNGDSGEKRFTLF
ncbi:UNVERIFIED_CONTAM: hypothetical protein PYX00_011880 [Menopon gallinae]|uniref:Transmembrane protein n=1 Tax=Menopon gallinae TaxID=328185 RepID=A0AAW2H9E4_9NEOP